MRIFTLLLATGLFFADASIASAQERLAGSLTVYAATSLTDAFEALEAAFVEAHPEVEISLNFANSATLAAQILAGAGADVFASANELQMEKVIADGGVDEAAVEIFAHNRLALIVPADNPAGILALEDLARERILLVLAAPGTPIRAYTDAMLKSHNSDYGEDFSARVMRSLVSEESNVRQVVARVALGEADAGVVYQSDALGDVADKLTAIDIDERHNQIASYPIAPIRGSAAVALARAFIGFARSEAAQTILAENGFCWPPTNGVARGEDTAPTPIPERANATEAPEIECEAATIDEAG